MKSFLILALSFSTAFFSSAVAQNNQTTPPIQQNEISEIPIQNLYQLLRMSRERGDRRGEIKTLYRIGTHYTTLEQQETAIQYLDQALRISRELGNREMEAEILSSIALSYNGLKQLETAIQYFDQALPIFKELGDREGEAGILSFLKVFIQE